MAAGRFYVYELVDPRDGTVFYVGKGKANRIGDHEAEAHTGVASAKCDRIRAIEADGRHVERRKVAHFADEQDAYDAEAQRICAYGLARLTNIIPGGGTARGMPTVFEDRLVVSGYAEMVNRTRNGSIAAVFVAGHRLDLREILDLCKAKVATIVQRRGYDWANAISKRFGVEFENGSSQAALAS